MKKIISAAVILAVLCLGVSACGTMDTDKDNGSVTTTESKLKQDADKIKDDLGDAASDAGEKVSEKLSEAGSTVKEGMENAKEDISEMLNTDERTEKNKTDGR